MDSAPQVVAMEITCDDGSKVEFAEMFPRWFDEDNANSKCDDSCFLCTRPREKDVYERGTFGVVAVKDNHVIKVIRSNEKTHIMCPTAMREITAYALLGTNCLHITRCLQPPQVDKTGNIAFKLEQAHGSLLYFSRCTKVRKSLPGFENLSVHFLLWSLLRAVAYMNKCNLLHRDIKPGNILVFPGPRVALCDFGGCRVFNKPLETLDADMSDTVCTKNYAPPEEVKCKHSTVFDSFSIGATVIHYAMSATANYKPLLKVNRRTFTKLCKPYPGLLTILRLLCRCDPGQRYTPQEALQVFEDVYPHLVSKYEAFTESFNGLPTGGVPSSLAPMSVTCTWERFHNFKPKVWPCILECIRICQDDAVMDGRALLAVAFYTLNMLQNLHSKADYEACTELRCYVMLIPCFIRTAFLLVGSADDTDDYLPKCHELLMNTSCRCVVLHNVIAEAIFASHSLFANAANWVFPEHMKTLVDLQDSLHL